MKRAAYLGFGLGAAAALYAYSRTQKGADTVSETFSTVADTVGETVNDTVGKVVSAVRGIRNNNPGNIRRSNEAWKGLSPEQTDPEFFQFQAMPYGIRAIVKILRNYSTRYNLNTVAGIINRWAPPNENDTGAYVRYVAGMVGVGPGERIDLDDTTIVFSLVRAIMAQENGRVPAMLISDSDVWQGIELS